MNNRLFIGGLPFSVTSEELKSIFSEVGEVIDAKVITDKFSGRSKGFGFVQLASDELAQLAIEKFNNFELQGRKITVNVARPMEERRERYPSRGGDQNNGFNKSNW